MTWNAIAQNIYLDSKSDQIMALGQTVGKRRWASISCNVLPANRFSHKLCSLFLGQDQVWAIQDPIPPVSITLNWDWVSWMTFTYTTFHMCVLVATSGWKSPSNCSLTEVASPKSSCALSNQVHRFLSELKTKKANHLWRSPGSEARTKVQLAIVFLVTRRGELSV